MTEPSTVEAIRPLLPGWTAFSNLLLLVPGAFALGAACAWIGGRIAIGPLRALGDASWVERARAAHPLLRACATFALPPAILLGMLSLHSGGPLSWCPAPLVAFAVAASAYLGSFAVRRRFAREARGRGSSFGRELAGEFTGLLVLAPQLYLLLPMLLLLRPELDASGIAILVLAALGFAFAAHRGGMPFARALGLARPAPPRLAQIVARASDAAGVSTTGTWVIGWPVANAIAYPNTGELAFTEEICELLDDDELAAIAHHELGHLSEPRSVRLGRMLGASILFPIGAISPLLHHAGIEGTVALFAGLLIFPLFLMRMLRRMEVRADEAGHRHTDEPAVYARALEKVYAWNLAPAVTGVRHAPHPDLYDRMCAAGVEPAWPRPAPPDKRRGFVAVLAAATVLALCAAFVPSLPRIGAFWSSVSEDRLVWAVAASGGRRGLLDLGIHRGQTGAREEAVAFVRAAAEARPRGHHASAYLATLHAQHDRCEDSAAALRAAESRVRRAETLERCSWLAQARAALSECSLRAVVASADPGG